MRGLAPVKSTSGGGRRSAWRAAAAIALAAALAGCVTSKRPLFDPSKSAMPVAAGKFVEQTVDPQGRWVDYAAIELTREGRTYQIRSDKDSATPSFTVQDVGGGFYVGVLVTAPDKEFLYVLFEKHNEGFDSYEPVCSDFQYVRLPNALWPALDGKNCVYDNREKLTQALLAYARLSHPTKRYIPVKR